MKPLHAVQDLIDFEIFVPHLSDIFSNLIGDFWEKLKDWLCTCSIQILILLIVSDLVYQILCFRRRTFFLDET